MSASFYNLLKYAATGIASPDMTYYDRMRASTLMGGSVQTLTGQPPLSFKSDGSPLISWSMKGNGSQSGTPTPDNPVMPTFCGKLVDTDWTIPLTCAGQTVPVYLGQTQTVRRVRKFVLTGEENWQIRQDVMYLIINGMKTYAPCIASHYKYSPRSYASAIKDGEITTGLGAGIAIWIKTDSYTTPTDFKSYLASEYVAGHPVTVWYVLAEPETAIVNEPLAKIGDYADELHSTDAAVTIPTIKGINTLTVGTDLQPSEMTIVYQN